MPVLTHGNAWISNAQQGFMDIQEDDFVSAGRHSETMDTVEHTDVSTKGTG